jgi:hypothetical protein
VSIFKVYEAYTWPKRVVLETDDWVEAEERSQVKHWPSSGRPLHIDGTHPTHDWGPPREGQGDRITRRCRNCDGWDNGSYGSHAPCGYDFSHDSLASALERELAKRGE